MNKGADRRDRGAQALSHTERFNLAPMPDLIQELEQRRDALASRLARVSADPSHLRLEGFRYADPLKQSAARATLQLLLLTGIDAINDQIRELIEVVV